MSGKEKLYHLGLTEEEEVSLKAFRQQLLGESIITAEGDSLGTQYDHILLRFLRARKFDLLKAKTMLQNCLQWRRTVCGDGIDAVYRRIDPYDYPERQDVFKYWPLWYHKTDKKGRAINVQRLGSIDAKGLYNVVTPDKFWEIMVSTAEGAMREILPGSSYQAGRLVDSLFVIVDLQGFGLGKFWQVKDLVRDSFQMTQDYLPETMGQLAVINAPYGFATIWGIAKGWLAKETQEKVHIFGSDYQSFLLEHVDAENLPETLGGKCTCIDEGGCHMSNTGPWMIDRPARRKRFLKGEIERPGLGLEDLGKGIPNGSNLDPSIKSVTP